MILDSVIIENFGVYQGRIEVLLTPENGKPVILFGGMNGGGKTTLLDAIQLVLYGAKANTSSRGKLGYRQYLKESINRNSDPSEGSSIILRFRKVIDGCFRSFELQRYWREGVKGIEEVFRVLIDGELDEIHTDHWDNIIETYMPKGLSHLFFFDGEQIKKLAEGNNTSEILGTALHSLLGLNLVDRLETDLKILERRKKNEKLDQKTTIIINQKNKELNELDNLLESLSFKEGELVNSAGRAAKLFEEIYEQFKSEGGELFYKHNDFQTELEQLKFEKTNLEKKYRELLSGPLPFSQLKELLSEVEKQAKHEIQIKRAKILEAELHKRDQNLFRELRSRNIDCNTFKLIDNILDKDRAEKSNLASEELVLDAKEDLAYKLSYLNSEAIPKAEQQANQLRKSVSIIEEKISRVEDELSLIPSEDKIRIIEEKLSKAKKDHEVKKSELEAIQIRKKAVIDQRKILQGQINGLLNQNIELYVQQDSALRILKHSEKVRDTLIKFRKNIVRMHAQKIENLMLNSFNQLLHKKDLVTEIKIEPESFNISLKGKNGGNLPLERLSAGEKQLLATSLLWGLARASGNPVPLIIDTPLGRLDSSHRGHLVQRYFPKASHQVILLSTDEEIVGRYLSDIKPYVTKTYIVNHQKETGSSKIEEGYFSNETTSYNSESKHQGEGHLNSNQEKHWA